MTIKTRVITFFVFLKFSFTLQAQIPTCGIDFYYDNAGNRIVRELCLGSSSLTEEEQEELTSRENVETIEDLSELLVFPNPTSGELQIKSSGISESNEVQILSSNGQVVLKRKLNDGSFNISQLTPGNHIILIREEDTLYTARIIKTIH